jgi:glycosyltransferase involved in cell wall biosynthesis
MNRVRVMEMIDRPSLGGGQTAVLLLAGSLDRSKFEVSVCSGGGGPLVDELRKAGVAHHEASFGTKRWSKNAAAIRRILEQERVDILHTHGGIAGFFGRRAARAAGTPVVIHTLHGIHYLHYRNPVLKRIYVHLERHFSRFTDKLVLVSDGDRDAARKYGLAPETKLAVIKNGLDTGLLQAARDASGLKKRLGLDDAGPVIGTVARLHRQKGVVYLVRAASRIRQELPGARVLCVGGGPLRSKTAKAIRKLGLEETVILLGETPDAAGLIPAFDVFVLPSLWEGLPFVLIEAAALGKPIVATNVAGNNEIITDGETGILVPARDPDALSAAVIKLLRDGKLAANLAAAARRLIPPRFTLDRMVRDTEELYLSALRDRQAGSREK